MSNQIFGSFELLGIRDAGDITKERVLMRALEPVSLQNYLATNSKTTTDGKLEILNDKVFWFPIVSVNAGEYIRLYTREGSYQKTEGRYGEALAVYHNFYWNQSNSIWGEGTKSNSFTIFKISSWSTALS